MIWACTFHRRDLPSVCRVIAFLIRDLDLGDVGGVEGVWQGLDGSRLWLDFMEVALGGRLLGDEGADMEFNWLAVPHSK